MDSNQLAQSRSEKFRNAGRQFQPLVNATKVAVAGASFVAGGIAASPHDTGAIHSFPGGSSITQQQETSTFRTRLHAVEKHTGLECQTHPRPASQGFATKVIQHPEVDRGNNLLGAESMHAYGFGKAMKQADIDHQGKAATHWTDGFCYPR